MSAPDRRTIVLGLYTCAIWAAGDALVHSAGAVSWVVAVAFLALGFASLSWAVLRVGPGLLCESRMTTRGILTVAFALSVVANAIVQAAGGTPTPRLTALLVSAALGLLIVLRRTRRSSTPFPL